MMDWVHCNVCYCQPAPDKKDTTFILTSCGHIMCNKCAATKENFCFICQSSCNSVSLSKQVPNDVIVYFTSPQTLFDKFIAQFERVCKFQDEQKRRLLKHQISLIEQKTKQRQHEIDVLEKENAALKSMLNKGVGASPMSMTPSPVPVTPLSTTPHFQGFNHQLSSLSVPRTATSIPVTNSQSYPCSNKSVLSTKRPKSTGSITPTSNIKNRIISGKHRLSSSPVAQYGTSPTIKTLKTPNSTQRQLTTAVGSTRLCVRTPPIDGRIGVIPGSKEARQLLSPSPRGSIPRENISSASAKRDSLMTLVRQPLSMGHLKSPLSLQQTSYPRSTNQVSVTNPASMIRGVPSIPFVPHPFIPQHSNFTTNKTLISPTVRPTGFNRPIF